MNKYGTAPLGDAIYQISSSNIKALGLQVSEKKNFEIFFLVPMFQLVTPGAGPVLTPGASYEQTW